MLQRRAEAGLGTNNAPDVFDPAPGSMEEPIPGQYRVKPSRRVHHERPSFTPDAPNRTPDPGNGYHRKMRNNVIQQMQKAAQNAKRAAQTQRAAQSAKYSSEAAAKATEKIVPYLQKKGYQLVTVSELIKYKTGEAPKAGESYD